MLISKVAKRYAQGFLDFSQSQGNTDVVFGEMKDLVKILDQSRDLNLLLDSPIIDIKKKLSITDEIFKSFSQSSQNLIKLVIKHGRESNLKGIAQDFINKVEDLTGVQRVFVTTASSVSAENLDAIIKSANLVNHSKKYEVIPNVNTELIGGYILRVGDQQVDASVRTKLNHIKKEFQLN